MALIADLHERATLLGVPSLLLTYEDLDAAPEAGFARLRDFLLDGVSGDCDLDAKRSSQPAARKSERSFSGRSGLVREQGCCLFRGARAKPTRFPGAGATRRTRP